MIIGLREAESLSERFKIVKDYQSRYKMNMVLGNMASQYFKNLNQTSEEFNEYLQKLDGRISLLSYFHDTTRKLLLSQSLDYDDTSITILDIPIGERKVAFSHAELIVFCAWLVKL